MHKLIILIPLLFCFSFCAPRVAGSTEALELTGRISIVGHAPNIKTVLHTPEPRTYLITGRWLAELKNLRGAKVRVKGRITDTEALYKLPLFDIAEYEILLVDNGLKISKPWVGTLAGDNRLYLTTDSGKTFELNGPLVATLVNQCGAKVWVTGSCSGFLSRKAIVLDAFGIIRPVKSEVY